MSFQRFSWVALSLVLGLSLFGGCQSNRPVGPRKVMSMKVSIPKTNDLKASLITLGQNEVLYRVDGVGMTSIKGTAGPFTTAAPDGSYDFSVDIPNGGPRVLSVQLNDVATGDVLAVGATQVDVSLNTIVNDIQVDLGSTTRTCYVLNVSGSSFPGETYTFNSDSLVSTLSTGAGYDTLINYSAGSSNPLTIIDAGGNTTTGTNSTIAYLGTGDFVDYDSVPPVTSFKTNSYLAKGAPAAVGDIYCIKPSSMVLAHAWVQVARLGNGVSYVGPIFRYRINSTKPYYEYERTAVDIAGPCNGGW